MHIFFEIVQWFVKLLMRIAMFFTKEKTNYLIAPQEVISYIDSQRICRLFHVLPSLAFAIILGVKILPDYWPYYARELEKNGTIVPITIFILFIPVAVINGIIIELVLDRLNSKYSTFKRSLQEVNDYD